MNPIVLVTTCWKYEKEGFNDVIRRTWLPLAVNAGLHVRMLYGDNPQDSHCPDYSWVMDCPDDYAHIAHKTKLGHAFALDAGFDHIFQCFADTYIHPQRLINSGFERYDYSGHFIGSTSEYAELGDYATGGSGYWLSKRASEIVVRAEFQHALEEWADDLWVGRIMRDSGIVGKNDLRYFRNGDHLGDEGITCHLSKGTNNYCPAWMEKIHHYTMEGR